MSYEDKCPWLKKVDGYCIYILKCESDTYYVGYTANLKRRVNSHFNGGSSLHTNKYSPIQLLHYEIFSTKKEALARERYLHKNPKWITENEYSFCPIPKPTEQPNFDELFPTIPGGRPMTIEEARKIFTTVLVIQKSQPC